MEKGTIVRLSKPDPDDLAGHFPDTSYPIYGIALGYGQRPRFWMYIENLRDIEEGTFVGWFIHESYLEIVEEP